jgi:hypothetical protein
MPALAYTSGKYSLPSAADARGQFGRRESRFGCPGALAAWLTPRSSSDPKVTPISASRQALRQSVTKSTQSTVS